MNVLPHPEQTPQVASTVKPGLTKAHPTLICTPRMWLSAWRSRKSSRSRPARARHLRRGPSGWPRAPCRVLTASPTSLRAVSDVFLQNTLTLSANRSICSFHTILKFEESGTFFRRIIYVFGVWSITVLCDSVAALFCWRKKITKSTSRINLDIHEITTYPSRNMAFMLNSE